MQRDRRRLGRRLLAAAAMAACVAAPALACGQEQSATSLADQLPRLKPLEPQQALKTFRVAQGFRLELVAAEPLVSDPVDACFDADGRMFVAEMHGYPFSHEPTQLNPLGGGKKDACLVRLLEDTDGDGTFEKSSVFADQLSWAISVCCYRGGVFVLAPQHLYYFKDHDGDGRADERRIVYSGFSRANVQALANNLKWHLDHHIYLAGGRNGGEITHDGRPVATLRNQDVRFDPLSERLELVSGGSQFGHSLDDWGNRFVCSNSNHIEHVLLPSRYLDRNPYLAVSEVRRSIAREGPAARVFRTSPPEPWRILRQIRRAEAAGYKLVQQPDGGWKFEPIGPKPTQPPPEYPVGYFTSATGVTIYRGDAYPPEYRGNVFVGDVGGNLVHRKTLSPQGVGFVAERADVDTEFITSTDNWFRPVNFVNAPDGTLFVLDMYRETIEHPHSIPEDIKAHLDLESGFDRGRIYRLAPPGFRVRPVPRLSRWSTAELVAALESPNAWERTTADRLLWERADEGTAELLVKLLHSSKQPLARLHALWLLEALQALTPDLLLEALADPHAGVREHAVRLSEPHLNASAELARRVAALAGDTDARVRFQVAFSLGEWQSGEQPAALARLAPAAETDSDLRIALLSSAGETAADVALRLLNSPPAPPAEIPAGVVSELARMAATRAAADGALRLLAAALSQADRPALQAALFRAVGEGLARRGTTIAALLDGPDVDPGLREDVRRFHLRAAETSLNPQLPLAQRRSAVGMLAFAEFDTAARLAELLTPHSPQELQTAVVRSLAEFRRPEVAEVLLAGWRGYSPAVRREVVDALLQRRERIDALLEAVGNRQIQRGEIDRDKLELLLNHPQAAVRDRAREVLGSETAGDRLRVVQELSPRVLSLSGSAERGRAVFTGKCASCHKFGEVGHPVGPDLASVQNKSAPDLLIAILDPNREAQPNFTVYTVVTQDGKLLSGIITSETASALTLTAAEAKHETVLRSQIELLVSSGKSLMPEGLEKDLTPEELADLIAFVQTLKPPQ